MILAIMRMKAEGQNQEELVRVVVGTVGPTRVMPGCLDCKFCRSLDEDGQYVLHSEWRGIEELEAYLRAMEFGSVMVAMDLLAEPPQVRFHTVSRSSGMEVVEAALRER